MALRVLIQVGSYVVLDCELFRREETAAEESAGSVGALAAGELADQEMDGTFAVGLRGITVGTS